MKVAQRLVSELEGTMLVADWVADWVSSRPATREGASGKPDLFVHTHDWFDMIRAGFPIGLQKIYSCWIHKYRYGLNR
jgi:hypothetical protein